MDQADYIVLNEDADVQPNDESLSTNPLDLAKSLQKLILKLKGLNIVDEKTIDYAALVENELFKRDYTSLAAQLKHIKLTELIDTSSSDDENDLNLLAFFINVYNSLTIHAMCYLRAQDKLNKESSSILNQVGGKFWSLMAYRIDSYVFSLDDIEHGVLRANRVHPSSNRRFFADIDPRLAFVVKNFDSRIHFALNCGAKGCPPIAFYTPANVKHGLQMAAINYCSSECQVDVAARLLKVPRLFLWYKFDFVYAREDQINKEENHDPALIKYVGAYLRQGEENYVQFNELINQNEGGEGNDVKVDYLSYDWTINARN